MKKSVVFFIILLSFISTVNNLFAASIEETFFEANRYYADGYYKEAADKYEQLRAQGVESGNLYYNLGNAYFKLKQKGRARVNYERAKKFISQDEDLFENSVFVKSILDTQPPKEDIIWYERIFISIRDAFSAGVWFVMAWCTFLIISIIWMIGLFNLTTKKTGQSVILVLSGCFLFLLIFCLSSLKVQNNTEWGIIITPQADIRYSPSYSGAVAFKLTEGMKAQILRREGQWIQIRLTRKNSGWIEAEAIERI